MKCKTGKEEIVFLLTRVLEKFELERGQTIIRNSNRKNYEEVAFKLSEISNELPRNQEHWQHQFYEPDYNPRQLTYPQRKYDITGNQIKDAYYNQIVSRPRPFLVDACYIYLYGVGRVGFEKNPLDPGLLESGESKHEEHLVPGDETASKPLRDAVNDKPDHKILLQQRRLLLFALSICLITVAGTFGYLFSQKREWAKIKNDFNILPYQPTNEEVAAIEGIWLCYSGSPQARITQPYRYHVVVPSILDVKYDDGYFTFKRYDANFDHSGYMQFEAPGILSIHSFLLNPTGGIEYPKHSLMYITSNRKTANVISASWNYDVGVHNQVIGIREVYTKVGKGGIIKEIMNGLENGSCNCKIIEWAKDDNKVESFYLRNQRLETLTDSSLIPLLDERSIIPAQPSDGFILTKDTGVTFPGNL